MLYRLVFMGMIVFINILSMVYDLKAYRIDQVNILYTKIPHDLKDKEDLVKIVEDGRKSAKFFYLELTGLALILAAFLDSISIMILDTLFLSLVRPFFLQKDIDKVRNFKDKHVKKQARIKVIDLELLERIDDFKVSRLSYLPIIIIYGLSIFLALNFEEVYPKLMWVFLGLVFLGGDIFIDRFLMKRLIKTYTADSRTNISLNEKIGKSQGKILHKKSLIDSISFLILTIISIKNPYSPSGFIIFILAISVNILYSFYKFDKLKNTKDLKEIEYLDYDQADYYTAWGYNDPDDPRLFVPSLYGIGTDLNFGKVSGKIYYLVTIILMFALFIFSAYTFYKPRNYSYTKDEDEIKITSTMLYKDTIEIKDIEKINLLDSMPGKRIVRIGGDALEKTSTGTYRIEDYGKVRLYIYNDTKKIIEIKTKDKNYLVNQPSDKETEDLYRKLLDLLK